MAQRVHTWGVLALLAAAAGAAPAAGSQEPSPAPLQASPESAAAPPVEAAEPAVVRPELVRLLEASRRGELEVVKQLVEAGEPVNQPPGWRTPLIAASLHGHLAVVDYLLSKGAEVNARDRQGRSALWAAVWNDQPKAFARLLEKGAHVNVASAVGEPLLFMAVERGRLEMARALVEHGAEVDRPSKHPLWPGYTALQRAVTLRNLELIRMLLDAGADPRVANGRGQTAADLAEGLQAQEIRALLEAAARRLSTPPAP